MVGQQQSLNGHKLEQTPGDSGGQRSLVPTVHAVAERHDSLRDRTTKQNTNTRCEALRKSSPRVKSLV